MSTGHQPQPSDASTERFSREGKYTGGDKYAQRSTPTQKLRKRAPAEAGADAVDAKPSAALGAEASATRAARAAGRNMRNSVQTRRALARGPQRRN